MVYCCISDVIASLLLNKAPKIELVVPYSVFLINHNGCTFPTWFHKWLGVVSDLILPGERWRRLSSVESTTRRTFTMIAVKNERRFQAVAVRQKIKMCLILVHRHRRWSLATPWSKRCNPWSVSQVSSKGTGSQRRSRQRGKSRGR